MSTKLVESWIEIKLHVRMVKLLLVLKKRERIIHHEEHPDEIRQQPDCRRSISPSETEEGFTRQAGQVKDYEGKSLAHELT